MHMWTVGGCVVYSGIMLLLLFIPLFFFLSNFQALKIIVGVFSETVRPRRLKLRTNMNSGYCVYRAQDTVAYSSVFFLSNFQTLKCFGTLFLGTVRPRYWKLVAHVDCGRMYRLYRCCCLFIPLFLFFSPVFKHLNFS